MAIKLTSAEVKELTELADKARDALQQLGERIDEIATDWEEQFSEKSEKWQTGDRGLEAESRIGELRSIFDNIPMEIDADFESFAA